MDDDNETRKTPEEFLAEAEQLTADIREEIGDWEPPTNKRWREHENPILPTIRLAWMTLVHKSSDDVRKIVEGLSESDPAVLARLMRELNWTGGYLEKLQHLCQIAELRLVAHGAPEAVQDWLHDNPLPPEPPQDWRAPPKLKLIK